MAGTNGSKAKFDIRVQDHMVGWRLDRVLATLLTEWSRSGVEELIQNGGVRVGGVVVEKGSMKLKPGEVIEVDPAIESAVRESRDFSTTVRDFAYTGNVSAVIPEDIPLDIVYEDDDVLVVDKPHGMVIHPAYANPGGTLVNAVAGYFESKGIKLFRRIGLVHRLDKDVGGLVLIAKNERSLRILSEQFSSEGITPFQQDLSIKAHKYYWAVVGPVEEKVLKSAGLGENGDWREVEGCMMRCRGDRKRFTFKEGLDDARGCGGGERYALSYMRRLKNLQKGYWHLEVQLVTGRTHQIRAQLASLDLRVAGDVMYGGKEIERENAIGLRCVRISFIPPRVYKKPSYKEISMGMSVDANIVRRHGNRIEVERMEVPLEDMWE